MQSIRYEASKEISPGREMPNLGCLNLMRERDFSGLVFRVFASITEKPATIEVGESVFYPEKFRDARKAREIYDSITNVSDFMAVVNGRNRLRGNMVPMGGGDDDIMIEEIDHYDDL